jgi:hypothetical protein
MHRLPSQVSAPRLYSTPAFAVCALFGGPLAAIAFAGLQSRAMGRLGRDLPWLGGGGARGIGGAAEAKARGLLQEALVDLGTRHVPLVPHLAYRALALVFFYAYWTRLRPGREALLAAGAEVEPGYAAGVVALLAGLVGGTLLLVVLRG